jgi:hypothetical protein
MRIAALIALALVAWLAGADLVGAAVGKRSPRLERLAPRAADLTLARKALIRTSDVGSDWKGGVVEAADHETPDCAWQDYSAFTITGQAESDFSQTGARVISQVQVFARPAQAMADFRIDTRKGTPACEGRVFAKALGHGVRLVSAEPLAAPKVGERAAAYRFVLTSGSTRISFQVLEFVRGRALAGVVAFSVGGSIEGLGALARAMDVRLQAHVA